MFTFGTKISMAKAVLTKNSPFYVQFYISKFCHQKCKMCNIVEANADLEPFDKDKIEKIAENLKKVGVGVVLLTGGEPFMRPDIALIVKAFKSRGMDVRMQTAGLFSKKELIKECVENGARDINVSIDSLDEKLSDYINGLPGSWRNAMKTISYISRTFPKKDTICALGCVLSRYNIDEIENVLEFSTRIGWWLSLVPVHITDVGCPLNFRGYDNYFKFHKSDYKKVKDLIERLKKKKREGSLLFDSDDYLDSIVNFVETGHPSWRKDNICDSPNLYFGILPDGQFAPCCDHRYPGKLMVYDDNFPSIYRSEKLRKTVRRITSKCPGCNFGSYPEMTLSARSFSTILERVSLQFKAQNVGIRPISEKKLFSIIEDIRSKNANYYKKIEFPHRDKKKWPKVSNIPKRLWNQK